jgi:Mn2+/Fe2+ NRAMP family transporter
MMLVATRPQVMGKFVLSSRLRFMGWLSTAAMALAAIVMIGMIGSWVV